MKNRIFSISTLKRFIASLLAFSLISQSAMALTFTVDNTGDGSDAAPGDGVCATGAAVCTLRAAVEEANNRTSGDTIDFGIGAGTVVLGSSLSVTTGNFTIQNTSGSKVGLDGNNGAYDILTVSGDTLTIDGNDNLYFYNSSGNGITINNTAENISINDITVGLDAAGTVDATSQGIWALGDDLLIDSSVISGNSQSGIYMKDGVSDVTVSNNMIGLDSTGATDKGNGANGIQIDSVAVSLDFDGDVGGTGGQGLNITNNTISGNTTDGIVLGSGAQNIDGTITISDNEIGTNAAGTAAIANGQDGIDGTEQVIGDWTIQDNTISGNSAEGINIRAGNTVAITNNEIGFNAAANAAIGNTYDGISVDGTTVTITGNTIGNNGYDGISVNNGDDLTTINITNNDIGYIDSVPGTDFGNGEKGIDISSQNASTVNMNADLTTTANKISYNNGAGVNIGAGVTSFTATGNVIGYKDTGGGVYNAAAANLSGISVSGSSLTTVMIGGVDATDDKNLIKEGITILDTAASAAITIKNNYVGVGTGNTDLVTAGVTVNDGNTVDIISNVIGNSTADGILIGGGVTITVQGNLIGVGANGTTAMANTGDGLEINASTVTSAVIGTNGDGTNDVAEINVFVANTGKGININNLAANTSTVSIKGNYIGIAADGTTVTDLGNTAEGIYAVKGAFTIGETNTIASGTLGEGNIISNNTGAGVKLITDVTSAVFGGNVIGLKKNGEGDYATDAGNGADGVYISSSALTSLTVGATGAGNGNVISGNADIGLNLLALGAASTSSIVNNYIGLNFDGDTKVANDDQGIRVNSGTTIIIGGTTSAERNVISGNTGGNIRLTDLFSGTANILGNYIGINAAGTAGIDAGDISYGISIAAGTVNIGNGSAGSGNVISGNKYTGINIDAGTVTIKGNYVGLDATGETAIGNGVSVSEGMNLGGIAANGGTVTIGGSDLSDANKRNVISGNYGQGIILLNTTNAVIDGNYIGTDKDGVSDVGNLDGASPIDADANGSGILVLDMNGSAANGTIIGGATAGTNGNVISGNDGNGISIIHVSGGLGQDWTGGYIKSNYIGLAGNGSTSLSNSGYGIYVEDTVDVSHITDLMLGGSNNLIDTTLTYGIFLSEILEGALSGGYAWVGAHNTFSNPSLYTWQISMGGVNAIGECGDGVDNNSDGNIDSADVGCEYSPFVEGNISGGGGGGGTMGGAGSNQSDTPAETLDSDVEPEAADDTAEEPAVEEPAEQEPTEEPAQEDVQEYNVIETVVEPAIADSLSEEPGITNLEVDVMVREFEQELQEAVLEESEQTSEEIVQIEEQENLNRIMVSSEEITVEQAEQAEAYVTQTAMDSFSVAQDQLGGGSVSINVQGEQKNIGSIDEVEIIFTSVLSAEQVDTRREDAEKRGKIVIEINSSSDLDGDGLPDLLELGKASLWADHLYSKEISDLSAYFLGGYDIAARPTVNIPKDTVSASKRPALWLAGQPGDNATVVLVDADKISADELQNLRIGTATLASKNNSNYEVTQINLGTVQIDDGYKGILVPDFDIPNGRYYVIAKGQEGIGQLTTIQIDSTKEAEIPSVKAFRQGKRTDCVTEIIFDWATFTPRASVNCSFVEDEEPATLTISTPPGIVNITWESLILNSVIISDKSQEIAIDVPDDLPEGDHEAIVFVEDPTTGVRSGIYRYIFRITR